MPIEFKTGDVISYPYLWRREAENGETEGRKKRPACVAIAITMRGKAYLYLLPVTSKSPSSGQSAVEIPELERRRVGLDSDRKAWLVVSEYNRDIVGESFYLNPNEATKGRFSERFMMIVQKAFHAQLRSPGALVKRTL